MQAMLFLPAIEAQQAPDLKHILEKLPHKYGKLKAVKINNPDSPFVVHIKDYHCQYDLQKNIHNILYYTISSYSNDIPVCIEGAAGNIDTALLASIPDDSVRNYVSDYLMKTGKLSGAEYYSITSNPLVPFAGAEEPDMYNEGYRYYETVLSLNNELNDKLSFIDTAFTNIFKEKIMPGSYDLVESGLSVYDDFSIDKFIAKTEKYWSKIPHSDFPHSLIEYNNLLKKRNAISPDGISKMQNRLFEKLSAELPEKENKLLVKTYLSFQLGEIDEIEFIKQLVAFSKNLKKTDESIDKLSQCAAVFESLESYERDIIINDCRKLYLNLKKYCLSESEQEYSCALDAWHLLKKLHSLEMTRDNFANVSQDQIDKMFQVLQTYIKEKKLDSQLPLNFDFFNRFHELTENSMRFYKNSMDRDRLLLENALKQNGKAVILITGGFHSQGLIKLMDQKQLNYAVIQPQYAESKYPNFYKSIMNNLSSGLDEFFPIPVPNRLAPRVRIANLLANPELTGQMIKEAVLLAKVMAISNTSQLFDQLHSIGQISPYEFNEQTMQALADFTERWINKYKEIQEKKKITLSIKELRDVERHIASLVYFERADIENNSASFGVQITESTNEVTRIQVTVSEQKTLTGQINANLPKGIDKINLGHEEIIGNFRLYFHRLENTPMYTRPEPKPAKDFSDTVTGTESIEQLVDNIVELKLANSADPFDSRIELLLAKKLQRLAKFLRFVSNEELKRGNTAQSLLLRANAALYEGSIDQASVLFESYVKLLPPQERNLAGYYFAKGVFIRGQKIELTITDERGRPYVDRYGKELKSPLFDDTLVYGSEPSIVVQNRLIELANKLDAQNKKYLATVMRSAAQRLTDMNRNYHHHEVDLAYFNRSGQDAYVNSHLGSSLSSYGALGNPKISDDEVRRALPSVTYVYDQQATDEMQKAKDLRVVSEETALAYKTLKPESIAAVLVNKLHLKYAMAVMARHPRKNLPVLDTKGNLLWQNAPLDSLIADFSDAFAEFEQREKQHETYTYVKKIANPSKIVAFGDQHSDYTAFFETLKASGIIDENGDFIAPAGTVVVINGDFIDRGPGKAQKTIIDMIMKLQKQAQQKQAHVIAIMGNHEAMFLSGNWYDASVDFLNDFLNEIGFTPDQSSELRKAFEYHDLFKIAQIRAQNPESMKYIDFLWNLPVIANVGSHVFVHGGPTKKFNEIIEAKLKANPGWTVETAIENFYQDLIDREGFGSIHFKIGYDSVLAAAPEFTTAPFVTEPEITAKFLSFFPGANFVAVGHNKALGILGAGEKSFAQIQRITASKNIIKLDVGTNYTRNAQQRQVEGRAYIVDPKEINFASTVSQTGKKTSLIEKGDRRFNFLGTDASILYDSVLAGKTEELEAEQEAIIPDKDLLDIQMFFRIVFMIYATEPQVLNSAFKRETFKILDNNPRIPIPRRRFYTDYEIVNQIYNIYMDYIEKIVLGQISPESVDLKHFQQFLHANMETRSPKISAKEVGGKVLDYENNVGLFYSIMYQSDIETFPQEMLDSLKSRMKEVIDGYKPKVVLDPILDQLRRVQYYMDQADKLISFKTLRVNDGNPGIFLDEDGTGIMGFIIDNKIFLSRPLVDKLWNMYKTTANKKYLDRLLALMGHEIHEYREGRELNKDERRALHYEAEKLEIIISGQGETGSSLDDEIDALIKTWKFNSSDQNKSAIDKFLQSFRKYLSKSADMELYRKIFTRLGVPVEAGVSAEKDLADQMFGILVSVHPLETFRAIIASMSDPTMAFVLIDHNLFSEKEMLMLIGLITSAQDLPAQNPVAANMGNILNFMAPATPKPESVDKKATATRAVESSI